MRKVAFGCALLSGTVLIAPAAFAQRPVQFPKDYKTWTHVTTTVVNDKKHPAYGVRHIYVNAKGKKAALSRAKTFPDGTEVVLVFFNVVDLKVPNPKAKGTKSQKIMTGKRFKLDHMVKDSAKYAQTGGWNYSRFLLPSKKYLGKVPYVKACFGCHNKRAKKLDFVFTRAAR